LVAAPVGPGQVPVEVFARFGEIPPPLGNDFGKSVGNKNRGWNKSRLEEEEEREKINCGSKPVDLRVRQWVTAVSTD